MKNLNVLSNHAIFKITKAGILLKLGFNNLLKVCLVIFVFSLTISSCGKTDGNTCGPETTYHNPNYKVHHRLCSEGIAYRDHFYEDVSGTPEDICADEHINTEFAVTIQNYNDKSNIVSITAKVYWGAFFEEKIELSRSKDSTRYEGKISNIGLKQAFQDNPGYAGVQLIVRVATTLSNSCNIDEDRLDVLIDKMDVKVIYYKEL